MKLFQAFCSVCMISGGLGSVQLQSAADTQYSDSSLLTFDLHHVFGQCYALSRETLFGSSADEACQSINATPAFFKNEIDYHTLGAYVTFKMEDTTTEFWISLRREIDYRLKSDSVLGVNSSQQQTYSYLYRWEEEQVSSQTWYPGQPTEDRCENVAENSILTTGANPNTTEGAMCFMMREISDEIFFRLLDDVCCDAIKLRVFCRRQCDENEDHMAGPLVAHRKSLSPADDYGEQTAGSEMVVKRKKPNICPCNCAGSSEKLVLHEETKESIENITKALKKEIVVELKVSSETLSSSRRRKSSAENEAASSSTDAIAGFAVSVLALVVCVVVVPDVISLGRALYVWRKRRKWTAPGVGVVPSASIHGFGRRRKSQIEPSRKDTAKHAYRHESEC